MNAQGHVYLVCGASGRQLHGADIQLRSPPGKQQGQEQHKVRLSNLFLKWAIELCELYIGLHREGLVAGLVTPNCLCFSEFLHLSLDIGALLSLRKSLKDNVKDHFAVTSPQSSGHSLTQPEETNNEEENKSSFSRQNEGSHLYYASPELLASIEEVSPNLEASTACKTDAWTLGCLLCNLLCGETPWDDLPLADLLQEPANHMERAKSWLGERIGSNLMELYPPVLSTDDWSSAFVTLLTRCFSHIPEDRPDITEIWHLLNCIESFLDFENDSEHWQLKGCWCLALGCDITSATQHATQEHGTPIMCTDETPKAGVSQVPVSAGCVGDEIEEAQSASILEGHSGSVTSLLVCGHYMLSASFDKSICVWSLQDSALVKILKGHSHKVMALAADQEALLCISGDHGGEICVWELETATSDCLVKWQDHQDWRYSGVASLAISEDNFLYSGSGDKTIKVWALQDYSLVTTMEGHKSLVSALVIDGEVLYSGSWDGTIRLWWRTDHSPLAVLEGLLELGAVRALAVSAEFLLAGYHSGKIQVWKDETCLNTLAAHDGAISSLCLDGDKVFSGSWDGNVKVWNIMELLDDATPSLVDSFGSAVASLACHDGKVYIGLATKTIIVKRM